jgi:uncharacterized protein YecT (DUF1311 family)
MKLICPIAAMVLIVMPAARAADCGNASTQMDMDVCAETAFKADDATLNQLYKQIKTRLGDAASQQKQLVAAQRAWVAFRDAECNFVASGVEGGSIYPMIVTDCRDELTKHRIQDFKTYLSCQEGDTSCPVPSAG